MQLDIPYLKNKYANYLERAYDISCVLDQLFKDNGPFCTDTISAQQCAHFRKKYGGLQPKVDALRDMCAETVKFLRHLQLIEKQAQEPAQFININSVTIKVNKCPYNLKEKLGLKPEDSILEYQLKLHSDISLLQSFISVGVSEIIDKYNINLNNERVILSED